MNRTPKTCLVSFEARRYLYVRMNITLFFVTAGGLYLKAFETTKKKKRFVKTCSFGELILSCIYVEC